jgi:hypothetical protein
MRNGFRNGVTEPESLAIVQVVGEQQFSSS